MSLNELWEGDKKPILDVVGDRNSDIESRLALFVSVHKRSLRDNNLGSDFCDNILSHEFPVIHVTNLDRLHDRLHIMLDYGKGRLEESYAELKITYVWDGWECLERNQFYGASISRKVGSSRKVGDIIEWAIRWAEGQGGYDVLESNCHRFSNDFMRDIVGYDTSARGHGGRSGDFDFRF
eukprot:TRINITY_DN549_c0_g1_i1.p1 TRINITY_DN549_c0_g1~~TRINITY_DN549_c0_g1_i1.p1  ORF type:complete len:180 (+),score=23.44 TRINITY_DN549_c0_g1_i1:316-855(+)